MSTTTHPPEAPVLDELLWRDIDRIPGFMNRDECTWLASRAATANSWTEVGVFCGRSALCIALHLPRGAWLHLVDLELGTITRAGQSFLTTYREIVQRRPDLQLCLYRTDSTQAAVVVPESDVVFIDADHGHKQVTADIHAWRMKCSTLCGHDYGYADWPGVQRAVEELCPGFQNPAGSIWVCERT